MTAKAAAVILASMWRGPGALALSAVVSPRQKLRRRFRGGLAAQCSGPRTQIPTDSVERRSEFALRHTASRAGPQSAAKNSRRPALERIHPSVSASPRFPSSALRDSLVRAPGERTEFGLTKTPNFSRSVAEKANRDCIIRSLHLASRYSYRSSAAMHQKGCPCIVVSATAPSTYQKSSRKELPYPVAQRPS